MITPILPVNKLSARVINHKVELNWSFADLNSNFSHYTIYKANDYFFSIEGKTPVATISSLADTFFTDPDIVGGQPYFYAVTSTENSGYENDHIYVLGPVVDFHFSIEATPLDTGLVGRAYRDTLVALGGEPPYIWEMVNGTLSDGLELLSTGVIEGFPEEAGVFQFKVVVQDSWEPPNADSLTYKLHVEESTGIGNPDIPEKYALWQNSPNPFYQSTMVRFDLPKEENVRIEVYNFLGQKIRELVNKQLSPGSYQIELKGTNLSPGIYYYRLNAGEFQDIKKAILIK